MWADAQRDGHPAEYRWHLLLNATKFGWRPMLQCRAVHNNNNNRFMALCPGLTGWAGTRRNGNWTTHGYANSRTGYLADWSTRGLDNSWTSELVDWTSCGLNNSRMSPVVVVVLSRWLCGHKTRHCVILKCFIIKCNWILLLSHLLMLLRAYVIGYVTLFPHSRYPRVV